MRQASIITFQTCILGGCARADRGGRRQFSGFTSNGWVKGDFRLGCLRLENTGEDVFILRPDQRNDEERIIRATCRWTFLGTTMKVNRFEIHMELLR